MIMAAAYTKIRLQKILKEGLRRCVYRRWEGSVSGKVLRTRTIDLERMYLGNTPYPIAKSPITQKRFPTPGDALLAFRRRITARRAQGYAPYLMGRRNRNTRQC
jgi:hypothetical protein